MRNMRMAWAVAATAGVVALGGCGGSGTTTADRPNGGTGPVGGVGSGGGDTTDRFGGTVPGPGGGPVSGTAVGTTPTAGAAPAAGVASSGGSAPSGGPASSGGPATSAAARSGDPCSLISATDVAKLAKLPPPESGGAPTTKPSQDGGGNHYCLVNDGDEDSAQVGIGPITRDEFDLQKMSHNTQPVTGLGEEALYSQSAGILKVYKAGNQLTVWVIHGGFGGNDPQTLAQEKAIAQAAVARM